MKENKVSPITKEHWTIYCYQVISEAKQIYIQGMYQDIIIMPNWK